MARRGGRRGGGGGGSSSGGGAKLDVTAVQKSLEAFGQSVNDLTLGAAGLAKQYVESSAEFKRADEAFKSLSSNYAFSNLENAAAQYAPGALPGIQGLRSGFQELSAEGGALARLQGVAEQSAELGMPLSKNDLGDLAGPILERQRMIEKSRGEAADVMNNLTGGTGVMAGLKEGLEAIADKIGDRVAGAFVEALYKLLPGGGGQR